MWEPESDSENYSDETAMHDREILFSISVQNLIASAIDALDKTHGIRPTPDVILACFLNDYAARIIQEISLCGVSALGSMCFIKDGDGDLMQGGEIHFEKMMAIHSRVIQSAMAANKTHNKCSNDNNEGQIK